MDYRLLYWTPDPESGERIIIALLFTDENHMALMFDTDFKKVSRVWPTHSQIVKVILDDIAHALAMATEDTVENAVERVLRDYAPQITASAKRSCAVEIDETFEQDVEDLIWRAESGYTPSAAQPDLSGTASGDVEGSGVGT